MAKPYEGIRVLDFTHEFGRYVGRLFADLGATVIKVEPSGGALDRRKAEASDEFSAEFEYFHASKLSMEIDTVNDDGKVSVLDLIETADVVVLERHGFAHGWLEDMQSSAPQAVITVVSPFGDEGPMADFPANDLLLQAAGGLQWLSGRPEEPPLRLPGAQSTMITGVYAAVATALALIDTEQTGKGHLVQVAVQECIAHSLQNSLQVWDFEKRVSMRGGEGTRDATEDIFRCKDGFIFLAAPRALGVSWNALLAWIGEKGHAVAKELEDDRWSDRAWRLTKDAKQDIHHLLDPVFAQYTKTDLTTEAMARKIVMGSVHTMVDVLENPQLAYRDYFTALPIGQTAESVVFPGAPYKFSEEIWSVSPAPSLNQAG